TAVAGSDYTATAGTLNFASGVSHASITIPVLVDGNSNEGPETFQVALSNPTGGASLGSLVTTQVTINDYQIGQFIFDQPSYTVVENAGSITVGVSRIGGGTGPVSVAYDTSDGTAK